MFEKGEYRSVQKWLGHQIRMWSEDICSFRFTLVLAAPGSRYSNLREKNFVFRLARNINLISDFANKKRTKNINFYFDYNGLQ